MPNCEYGNHPAKFSELYVYRDREYGIEKTINICFACLYKHVHKYYPGGKTEKFLLNHHPELEQPKKKPLQQKLI